MISIDRRHPDHVSWVSQCISMIKRSQKYILILYILQWLCNVWFVNVCVVFHISKSMNVPNVSKAGCPRGISTVPVAQHEAFQDIDTRHSANLPSSPPGWTLSVTVRLVFSMSWQCDKPHCLGAKARAASTRNQLPAISAAVSQFPAVSTVTSLHWVWLGNQFNHELW